MSNDFETIVEEIEEASKAFYVHHGHIFNFPVPKDFDTNGIFSHIDLPISEDEELPVDLLKYILGENYQSLLTPEIDDKIRIALFSHPKMY